MAGRAFGHSDVVWRTGWSVKFCLTTGITQVKVWAEDPLSKIWYEGTPKYMGSAHNDGVDLFETKEEARDKAVEKAKSKAAALRKYLSRIEKLVKEPLWDKASR